ncbi:MAG: aldehyde dehydrogenase family protein, partial [Alsobacter sp.]
MSDCVRDEVRSLLDRLGVPATAFAPGGMAARSPLTGTVVAELAETDAAAAQAAIGRAAAAFTAWR